MAKLYLLVAVTAVFIVGLSAVVYADPLPDTTTWMRQWTTNEWGLDTSTMIPYLNITSDWAPGYECDGEVVLRLEGEVPSVPTICTNDPDVHQVIRNLTPKTWTDWHVSLTNGTIVSAVVKKVDGSVWDLDVFNDGTGFDSYTALSDGRVQSGEQLDVWFRFNVDGPGDVTIDEYPTTQYIPEPSSLVALMAGFSAVGISMRRRAR